MDDYENDEYGSLEGDIHEHDVRGIIAFLRDCWLTHPNFTLGEILDEIFGGAIIDLSDEEVKEILKEFLIQNE